MKKWPIYSDFSILSHNSGNFGQNEKQVLFSEGGTSGTEPNRFPESSSVMCHNVVYQWSGSEHCPTIPLQAHCVKIYLFSAKMIEKAKIREYLEKLLAFDLVFHVSKKC